VDPVHCLGNAGSGVVTPWESVGKLDAVLFLQTSAQSTPFFYWCSAVVNQW